MRLHQTSEETQEWVKNRRKVWWQTTGIGIVVAVVTCIGFRDQIAAQLDWFVTAMHGPTELIQLNQEISTVTNDIRSIKYHISNIDRRLNIDPSGEAGKVSTIMTISTNKISQIDP